MCLTLVARSRGLPTSSLDPLEVLLGRAAWPSAMAHAMDTEGEVVSDIEDDEVVVASPGKTFRRPYSKREQQEMVEYLVRARGYSLVRGNTVWQRMEAAQVTTSTNTSTHHHLHTHLHAHLLLHPRPQVCKGRRTWQSMKEHFRRQVMARIHTFGLSWIQVPPH